MNTLPDRYWVCIKWATWVENSCDLFEGTGGLILEGQPAKAIDLLTGETLFSNLNVADEAFVATHHWPLKEKLLQQLHDTHPTPL